MLSRLLKEHQAKQNERKELQERRRREAISAATSLTEALVDHLNVGVAQAYVNQRKLDHEVKILQVQASQFSKQTAQWISMVEGFNQALKEAKSGEYTLLGIIMDTQFFYDLLGENACLYTCGTLVVLWILVWLYRDSLEIEGIPDKYVFVTGCDSGFGNLLCRKLDRRGFHVLAGCFTEKGADDLKRAVGPNLKTVLLNVTNEESIQKAMEWAKKEVGEKGLWGIVNNAGSSLPMGPSEWMKVEDFQRTLKVNMNGVIAMTMAFLPLIKKARGRIVNVASVLGRVAANGGGYCISKFAVEGFSDCLRRDLHYFGINVCIIEPGFFKTAVTSLDPLERELHRLWNQLSPEVKATYGDKYLDKYIKVQRLIMNAVCDSDLSKVTNCMEHALTAAHPRSRYSAGWDAKLLWIPLSYMPACVVDIGLKLVLPRPSKCA
ncbi:11-cis retinol dehydrogenase [Takifugu flavidus]|uniref:11-cis retinol dehydrogenase n=2 Tax=Takifugu flavidus TaxID=433684 RepID=A0A5C6N4X1_9TELE|nr:11-cis retinol dehydrogenase [Takifugu flavidus]